MHKHKHILIFTALFLFLLIRDTKAQLPANCNAPSPRVIIAGDSWAQYMADDGWHNELLKRYGHADKQAISETYETQIACLFSSIDDFDYAISGSEARQWADESTGYLQALINGINNAPDVEMVVLSIGGNDILRGRAIESGDIPGWYKNMDLDNPGSEAALFATVQADTWYIIDQVRARSRPNINFLISSYDFPNFNVESFCGQFACPKREQLSRDDNGNGSIDDNELMTDAELNDMMVRVETIRQGMASNPNVSPRVFYDNGMGLMHYYYGYDDNAHPSFSNGNFDPNNLAPVGVDGVAPFSIGGYTSTPSDRENFRSVGVLCLPGIFGADPIHLDAEGYEIKIKNQMDNILFEHYRGEPDATFYSEGANDGYVDLLGNDSPTSNGIRIGDRGGIFPWNSATRDYRGILSFNTSNLPDNAIITGASIYMIRSGAEDNPFQDKNPSIDIKNGYFGSTAGLESADGTDAADASNIGCFHGVADEDHYAIRIDLTASALDHVNLVGQTHFRLAMDDPDFRDEYINFYDGGGVAALGSPTVLNEREDEEKYTYRTIELTVNEDGTTTEREISKGPVMLKTKGFVIQEKLKSMKPVGDTDNKFIQQFIAVTAIEHLGLEKHMLDFHNAPAQGRAPFLDITYELLLPVELEFFRAEAKGQQSLLSWQTASEENSDRFEIERSIDGRNWEYLGKVFASGNSNQRQAYDFIDVQPEMGINYYRLRMIDIDGSEDFSDIRTVEFKSNIGDISIYPNPFDHKVNLVFNTAIEKEVTIQLTDMLGRLITSQQLELSVGRSIHTLDGLNELSSGTYIVNVLTKDGARNIKVIKR